MNKQSIFSKKTFQLLFFLMMTVLLSTTTLAYTQEEKLEEMQTTILRIKDVLDRCEEDVCRQVSLHADKRHLGVRKAQENPREASQHVEEIRAIVREDIANLNRCRADVCRTILALEEELLVLTNDYLDVDDDGDGIDTRMEYAGFDDFAGAPIQMQRDTGTLLDSMDILVRVPASASFMSAHIENKDDVRCEAYDGGVVCQDTRVSDGELFCWGNNRVQECPREITQVQGHGGGSGKVRVEDVVVRASDDNTSTEHHEEIEVLSWSWGASNSGGFDDDDGDQITLDYVWFVNTPMSSGGDDRPTESLSLAFGKIEITYQENGKSVELNVSDVELHGNLVFSTVTLSSQATTSSGELCGRTDHLLRGGDCNDEDPTVYPGRSDIRVEANNTTRPDYLDVDSDGDGFEDSMIAARNGGRASAALWTGNMSRGINPSDISQEERRLLREELQNRLELRGADFGLAVALVASENERVRTIRYDEERNVVEVEHEEEMRLFGLFRVQTTSRTTVHEDGTEETRRPWWSFLATKDNNPKFKAGADLSKSVNALGDFEYCPDGTMVQSLEECPDLVDSSVAE